ncbi:hypothetical protein [Haloechinothrix halophila]|uniref:hypothetical protein n=1 Tax=Haloechinothrix halophila TaxID=1069073 RepID=UPI0003F4E566|nr:hypothetical protein [Haloechinothrix halophila]
MTDSYGGPQQEPTGDTSQATTDGTADTATDTTSSTTSGTSAPTGGSGLSLGSSSSTAESIVDSARSVRNDFLYGDDRVILNPPNWASQSSTQLYNGAVNDNDPGFADSMGQTWSHHGTELRHVADALYEAITELSGVWVGEASGAAQGALIGVANASGTAGDAARIMGQRMSQQAAAAAEVKKMPPPKEFDYNAEIDKLLTGHPAAMSVSDLKAELDAAQAVRAEQQRYMDEYTRAMSEVDSATPSFGPESIGMKPASSNGYASSPSAASGSGVNVTGGGASLAGAQGSIDAATAAGARTGAPVAGGAAGSFAGGNVGHHATAAPLQAGSVAATGSSAVSAQPNGPGTAGLVGGAALGAGAGLAGARALAKGGGRAGGKRGSQRDQQHEAAEGAPAEAAQGEQGEQIDAQSVDAPGIGAPQHAGQSPSQQVPAASWQQPQLGTAAQGGGQGAGVQQGSWQLPQTGAPAAQGPHAQPLAAGATTGAADHAAVAPDAGQVTASTDNSAAAQPTSAQPQQPWQAQQAANQAGPVAPMQSHPHASGAGAGAGAAGVDPSDAEHDQASYLIEPDPDDLFGPTDRATTGVIGAEFEDD